MLLSDESTSLVRRKHFSHPMKALLLLHKSTLSEPHKKGTRSGLPVPFFYDDMDDDADMDAGGLYRAYSSMVNE